MAFALGRKALDAGYRLAAYDTIDSTNLAALDQALADDPGALWVVSEHQSAGRGRRGRRWETPRGNLAASVLAIVEESAAASATLGFVAGLALDQALRLVAPVLDLAHMLDGAEGKAAGDRIRLKWPNDVLVDGAKIAGILLETRALSRGRLVIVSGIGVNVVSAPAGLPYPTTCLAALGVAIDAAALFDALSDAWVDAMAIWQGGRGFAEVRDLWLERAAGMGAPAVVRLADEIVSGVLETIDAEGRLIVRREDGRRQAIAAGEVHFGTVATVRA